MRRIQCLLKHKGVVVAEERATSLRWPVSCWRRDPLLSAAHFIRVCEMLLFLIGMTVSIGTERGQKLQFASFGKR
jgi:hypothetical protein